MINFLKYATLTLAGWVTLSVQAQDSLTGWKWQDVPGENVELYIGNDTITENAVPITDVSPWWEAFGYPALDSLVRKAISNNVDLKIARARVEQARANKRIALAEMFPSIRFEPSFVRQEFSANRPNPFGGQLGRATLNTYELPLTLSYELDVFGKNINNVEANTLISEASEEDRKNTLLSVTAEIARNYFLLLQLDAENDLLQHTEKTRKDNLEITSTRYEAGLVSQIDVLRAKTELSSVQVQLKNNRQLRTEIELTLATLAGEDASTFHLPHGKVSYLPPSVAFMEKDSLALSRPDLKAAKLLLESSDKKVSSQWKELLPSFYLNGSYGYLSGNTDNLIEDNGRTWLAGISASLPIFEGGRKRSEIKLRRSELQEAKENYNRLTLESYRQVENAYARLQWVHRQLLSQQQFVVAARDAATLTSERYRKGLVNYIDVVDAERQVLEAERLSVQLFGQELTGRVTLIQSLGLFPDKLE
ncbi:efflux transporter outer membrane subunit [Sinomicrobium weinanense]|uniref:Efflux transporter outer membrane subunit n=1 Tax=Sinomicrobium weinanense TaxID=2842200 RepID=A0A926JSR6_9FLAO|nr:efflux transporter outer membrane subunit [Sinomicrobium weinanense]MBC9796593.1 efflux transporter outer membrane subunit [Sinomicrobium weinanense]MBU3123577.1 efflux transporter outer membrane subunit [Sinomicrobium weinanense]